jgi:hypothetical protein
MNKLNDIKNDLNENIDVNYSNKEAKLLDL